MKTVFAEIQPFRKLTGARVMVRVGDSPIADGFGAGGFDWEPAFIERPVTSHELMSVDLDGKVQAGRVRFSLKLSSITAIPDALTVDWQGAPVTIWTSGELSYARRVLEFAGHITSVRPDIDTKTLVVDAEVSIALIEKPLLIQEFSGGGGIAGDPALRGTLMPAGFGVMDGIEPVWFDETYNIGMIDGYGNTLAITRLMEGVDLRGASVGNYATYAALKQAIIDKVIPPGRWGTCIAQGLVGLGAPAVGVVMVDAVFGYDLPGSWMRRILDAHAGVALDNIETTAFDSLTAQVQAVVGAAPQTGWWTKDQRQCRDLLEAIAGSCNATLLVGFDGRVTVSRGVASAPVGTLNRNGSVEPRVLNWRIAETVPPFYELKARTARPARVLTRDEVLFIDNFVPRGVFDIAEVYRAGNTVYLLDGSEWLYKNLTASAGHAPPVPPTEEDDWWRQLFPPINYLELPGLADAISDLEDAIDGSVTIFYQTATPTADGIGDLWFKTDTSKWYRWTGSVWQLTEDAGIGQAITAAAGAQATADGKVKTFYQDATPTAEGVGDLWVRPSDVPKVIRRWSGTAWIAQTPATLAELDTVANAKLNGKITAFFAAAVPVSTAIGDLWFNTTTSKWYRAASIGADQIAAGEWVLAEDSGIGDAIAAAGTAQATADGKIVTFYQDATPTAEAVGDLWVKVTEVPKIVRRWSGSVWIAQTPANLAELDPAAADALAAASAAIAAVANDGIIRADEKFKILFPNLRIFESRFQQLIARAAQVGIAPAKNNRISADLADWTATGVTRDAVLVADPFGGTKATRFFHSSAGAAIRRITENTNTAAAGYIFFGIVAKYIHGLPFMRWSMDTAPGDIYWDLKTGRATSLGRAPQGWVRRGSVPLLDGFRFYWGIRQVTAADAADTHSVYFLDQTGSTQTTAGFTGGEVHVMRPQVASLESIPAFFDTTASDVAPAAGNAIADAAVAARSAFLCAIASNVTPDVENSSVDSIIFPFDNVLANQHLLSAWTAISAPAVARLDGYWQITDDSGAATEGIQLTSALTYAAGTQIGVLVRVAKDAIPRATRFVSLRIFQVSDGTFAEVLLDTETGETSTGGTLAVVAASSPAAVNYDAADWLINIVTTLTAASTVRCDLFPARGASAAWATGAAATGSAKFLLPQLFVGSVAERARRSISDLLGAWERSMAALAQAISLEDSKRADKLTVAAAQTIQFDSTGTTSSQLPKVLTNVIKRGSADVTALGAFTFTPSGCAISTAGLAIGQVQLDDVDAANASIGVSVILDGQTHTGTIPITRTLADPPGSGSGGGTGATSFGPVTVNATISDTSYDASPQVLAQGQMRSSAGGQIRMVLAGEYTAGNSITGAAKTVSVNAKAQRSTDGTTWTDMGLSATGTTSTGGHLDNGDPDTGSWVQAVVGTVGANSLVGGLSASTDYHVRWIAYGIFTGQASVGVSGTASGAQS